MDTTTGTRYRIGAIRGGQTSHVFIEREFAGLDYYSLCGRERGPRIWGGSSLCRQCESARDRRDGKPHT